MAESKEQITAKVIDIIAEQLGVEKNTISEQTDIANDLGADSLDIAELMIAFEEEFDIDIVEEDTQNITTVGQVVEHISKALDNH
ncbi:MAG: acyl carrier protein [Planctomycetia bacterium]|nr:acyl carrier protein [Planctomycetia bacterium]